VCARACSSGLTARAGPRQVRVSLFLASGIQSMDGTIALHAGGAVPAGADVPGTIKRARGGNTGYRLKYGCPAFPAKQRLFCTFASTALPRKHSVGRRHRARVRARCRPSLAKALSGITKAVG
jgi:hypothetical protein